MVEKIPQIEISKEYIKQFLPEEPTILEAGAHIGRDTLKMNKTWPKSIIYAFEPVRQLFERLHQNTANVDNIICFPYALSDKSTNSKFYVSKGRSTALSSLFKPIGGLALHPEVHFEETFIKTLTIDNWAKNYKIKKIDLIWLDLQGGELKALKGAKQILKTTIALFIEVNLTQRYLNAPTANELLTWLKNHNFDAIVRDKPKHNKTNILFIKYFHI